MSSLFSQDRGLFLFSSTFFCGKQCFLWNWNKCLTREPRLRFTAYRIVLPALCLVPKVSLWDREENYYSALQRRELIAYRNKAGTWTQASVFFLLPDTCFEVWAACTLTEPVWTQGWPQRRELSMHCSTAYKMGLSREDLSTAGHSGFPGLSGSLPFAQPDRQFHC